MPILSALLGHGQGKDARRYLKEAGRIGELEPRYQAMDDAGLRSASDALRERVAAGDDSRDLTHEAFALAREATKRATGKRPYDVQMVAGLALLDGKVAQQNTGEGKAISIDTTIPTPFGWQRAGDIQPGDYVFGRDGKPTQVIGVYPNRDMERYRVTFADGRSVICAGNHRWAVYTSFSDSPHAKTEYLVKTVDQMYAHGVRTCHRNGHKSWCYHVPLCSQVEYQEADLPLDPYVLGAFLGNGCRDIAGALTISSTNEFVPKKVAARLESILGEQVVARKNPCNYAWTFYHGESKHRVHADEVAPSLASLLVSTYSYDKYVPNIYLTASIEQRLELLRGLMDTDGHIDRSDRHRVMYSTTSPRLRDAVRELAWSLGWKATVRMHPAESQAHATHDEYTVRIQCDNLDKPKLVTEPTRAEQAALAAKRGSQRQFRQDRLAITSIELLDGHEDMVCFQVDAPDHLFLCGDYLVTHNTISAIAPTYTVALEGRGAHVVTVNDYLAHRDADDVGRVYRLLGLSCGVLLNEMGTAARKRAYGCDVTYGTNTEFGFDYLRDNMATSLDAQVQRGHRFAIVDEADSILIDEARTPLIISGAGFGEAERYQAFARAVAGLTDDDVDVDITHRVVTARPSGLAKVEMAIGEDIYADASGSLANHLTQALRARFLYERDRDYLVTDGGEVKIVDEFTGRVMEGRQWSEGLHQAIEAKEGVTVREQTQTLATVTIQNYFRLYERLSGMTGTAVTAADELRQVYGLDVVVVPPNRPSQRHDLDDRVYLTLAAKDRAIVDEVVSRHATGQPVLVGTASVESSERIARALSKRGIRPEVLNAKNHAREADIIAQAGRLGAVTVATNMAGRGTDIMLGGNPEYLARDILRGEGLLLEPDVTDPDAPVATSEQRAEALERARAKVADEHERVTEAGGLAIVGTERHDARRIDDQLRGRAGRQGDPGETVFFVSFEDDVWKRFGSPKTTETARKILKGVETAMLTSPALTKAIAKAQQRDEDIAFAQRKSVLDYDDVMDRQRRAVYARRQEALGLEDGEATRAVEDASGRACDHATDVTHDADELSTWAGRLTGEDLDVTATTLRMACLSRVRDKEDEIGEALCGHVCHDILLRVCDTRWVGYLSEMDVLKDGVGLRGYGQRDPLVEYKHDARRAFDRLLVTMDEDVLGTFCHMQVTHADQPVSRHLSRAERRRMERAQAKAKSKA